MENNSYEYHECLTNQMLTERFKNQFDLVRHAIKLAVHEVKLGHEFPSMDAMNIASKVLEEIAEGQDKELPEEDEMACGCSMEMIDSEEDLVEVTASGKKDSKKSKLTGKTAKAKSKK